MSAQGKSCFVFGGRFHCGRLGASKVYAAAGISEGFQLFWMIYGLGKWRMAQKKSVFCLFCPCCICLGFACVSDEYEAIQYPNVCNQYEILTNLSQDNFNLPDLVYPDVFSTSSSVSLAFGVLQPYFVVFSPLCSTSYRLLVSNHHFSMARPLHALGIHRRINRHLEKPLA